MGAPSGLAFLRLCGMMDHLGMKISSVQVRVEDLDVLMKFGIWRVNLEVATAVLMSCDMEPSLPVRITSIGVRKIHAPLRAASLTISSGSTVWSAP